MLFYEFVSSSLVFLKMLTPKNPPKNATKMLPDTPKHSNRKQTPLKIKIQKLKYAPNIPPDTEKKHPNTKRNKKTRNRKSLFKEACRVESPLKGNRALQGLIGEIVLSNFNVLFLYFGLWMPDLAILDLKIGFLAQNSIV